MATTKNNKFYPDLNFNFATTSSNNNTNSIRNNKNNPGRKKTLTNENKEEENEEEEKKNQFSTSSYGGVIYEGDLCYKTKTTTDFQKNWIQFWAVLRWNNVLCLYKHKDQILDEEDAITIDVESCIADVAYDYVTQCKSVFRVITQKQTEHLFKADNTFIMLKWLENLQHSATDLNANTDGTGLSNSMALIIKRYEAHNFGSPSSASSTATSKNSGGNSRKMAFFNKYSTSNSCNSSYCKESPDCSSDKSTTAEITPRMKHKKWRKLSKSSNNSDSCTLTPPPSPVRSNSNSSDAVFGQPLDHCVTGENEFVPLIVQLCVQVVERHGLQVVGVYRIPGNTANVNALIASLEKGYENADFNDQRWRDVNVVSSLVKAFFRKLPDSLLTNNLYQQFIDANRIEDTSKRVKQLKNLVEKLPKFNYETLKYLIIHLTKVVAHSHINKMQARNLALMFGPTILKPHNDNMTAIVYHMTDQCQVVETLIQHCDWIFRKESAECPFGEQNGRTEDSNLDDTQNAWKCRRNSRKGCKKQSRDSSCSTPGGKSGKVPTSEYQERNIDDEIENRRKVCENMFAGEAKNQDFRDSSGDLLKFVQENRRDIYAARRMFISGLGGDESSTDDQQQSETELAKMDCLLKHSRHLNGNPRSLDVFSPETREKIRRFQLDNEMLRQKTHWLAQQRHMLEYKRLKIERALEKTKFEIENDRFLDFVNADTSSVTSDYSTTSSNLNGHGQGHKPPGTHASPTVPLRNGYHTPRHTRNEGVSTDSGSRVPWYRENDDLPKLKSVGVNAVDFNGNNTKNGHTNFIVHADIPKEKLLKKIKARSQSISTEKRNVKQSSNDEHKYGVYRSDSTSCHGNSSDNQQLHRNCVQRKPSKTRKIKIWLKESFRRSSPDLSDDQVENVGEIVTKV